MNLTTINNLLAHEDYFIRETALQIADKKESFSPESTQKIIATIEKYGLNDSYFNTHWLGGAPLDDGSALWLLDFIEANASSFRGSQSYHFSRWFLNQAPLIFLEKHSDRYTTAIAALINTNKDKLTTKQHRRLDASQLTTKELHAKIIPYFNRHEDEDESQDLEFDHEYLYELIDLMGDDLSMLENDVLEGLSHIPNDEMPERIIDLNKALIVIAGKMKLEKAVPHLLTHMELDWGIFNEQVPKAIARIGTQSALEQTAEFYSKYQDNEESWIPNFLSSTFEKCQHPLTSKIAKDLLGDECDVTRRNNLIGALCYGMEEEHLPTVIEEWRESEDDPDFDFFINFFYTHAKLTGKEYPELGEWLAHLEIDKKKDQDLSLGLLDSNAKLNEIRRLMAEHPQNVSPIHQWLGEEAQTFKRTEEKISRNAPCPCGSGKKYKRCCMK